MDTSGLNELLKTILKSRNGDEIPSGWYTSEQLCKKANLKRTSMSVLLSDAMRKGTVERKKFRVTLNGRIRHVYFYKDKKQGKA